MQAAKTKPQELSFNCPLGLARPEDIIRASLRACACSFHLIDGLRIICKAVKDEVLAHM